MKTLFQKHQILESLNDLDQSQAEQVLRYIQGLVKVQKNKIQYHANEKREAMRQIRQALTSEKNLQSGI
jgi:hypothetical protein